VGIGGGASGVSGGLLHPYSPKGFSFLFLRCLTVECRYSGLLFSTVVLCYDVVSCGICWWVNGNVVKLLWEGAQCWKESMELLRVAEEASVSKDYRTGESAEDMEAFVAHKRFLVFFSFHQLNLVPPNFPNSCKVLYSSFEYFILLCCFYTFYTLHWNLKLIYTADDQLTSGAS